MAELDHHQSLWNTKFSGVYVPGGLHYEKYVSKETSPTPRFLLPPRSKAGEVVAATDRGAILAVGNKGQHR